MEAFPEPIDFGPYRLHAKIAQGGMAEVFLGTNAKREFQNQFLAIKKLLPHLNSNKPFVNLLIHEAKIGVLLNHPGIATVFDLGSYRSEFFLAMEYVHGKSLDRVLEKIRSGAQPKLSLELSTYIILELLRGLAFAHQLQDSQQRELNIVHRDISPGNILLAYQGDVKLTDFGVATAENRLQSGFTQSGLGKLAYMAPEQAVNDPVVRASDIYSLGVVFYELVTGQLPFQAENANALLKKVVSGKMADIKITGPTLSSELQSIITRCLDRSSRKRFQTAPELFNELHSYFKKAADLDFSSRTVRQYYRKKLSEYLRSCFQLEFEAEAKIIERGLEEFALRDDLQATAPVRFAPLTKPGLDEVNEATVFQVDHSNEATRQVVITSEERQNIVNAIPSAIPREGGKKTSVAHQAKQNEFSEEASLNRISVEDKLRLSALDKDTKESLKQHKPRWEITSQEHLDAFERDTFAGQRPISTEEEIVEDSEATRAMSRDKIFKGFDETAKEIRAAKNKIQLVRSAEVPPEPEPNGFGRALISTRGWLKKFSLEKYWKAIVVVSAAIVTTGILLGAAVLVMKAANRFSGSPLLPTQSISVIFTGEAKDAAASRFYSSLQETGPFPSFHQLERFFTREYQRYTGKTAKVIKLFPSQPSSSINQLSTYSSEIFKSNDLFRLIQPKRPSAEVQKGKVIWVYLYPFERKPSTTSRFPDEIFRAEFRSLGESIVLAPAHPSQRLKVLESLARQIAFIFGASNKFDPKTFRPEAPQGLAEPLKKPIYPQAKAELMGRDIALGLTQTKTILDLSELMIGPQTAYELGWIDAQRRDQLLFGGNSSQPAR